MDFQELDRILTAVEREFLGKVFELGVEKPSIERWRWDEPDITISWVGRDAINRNVHAVIIEEGPPTVLEVEVNAWKDWDEDGGKTRHRGWYNESIAKIKVPDQLERLPELIKQGFTKASRWDDNMVRKNVTRITPQPS